MEEEKKRVHIYKLEDPDLWVRNEQLILATLLKAFRARSINLKDPAFEFNINPLCGWISFKDGSKMNTDRQKTNLILDETRIRQVADQIIADIVQLSREQNFRQRSIPPILPGGPGVKIVFRSAQLVPHSDRPQLDHWLVRYSMHLKYEIEADAAFAPVLGSDIFLRLVNENEVIAFQSMWRPSFLVSEQDIQLPERGSHEHHDEGEGANEHDHEQAHAEGSEGHDHKTKVVIAYDSNGENCLQNTLLPFFVSFTGHDYTLQPASENAFHINCLEFYLEDNGYNTEITVNGGSGKFSYAVFTWFPDRIWDEGIVELASGDYNGEPVEVLLQREVQNLVIWAIDKETGIIRKQEQMFFPFPKIENNSQPIEPPIL